MVSAVRSHRPFDGMLVVFGALALGLSGCTITPDGVQQYEVPQEEIFPPSKTVASYRQSKKPEKIESKAVEEQIGSAQKLAILKKWGFLSTMMAEYGIPDRP